MSDDDNAQATPSKSPAFQFYPKDFLTDENVRVMSLQERGAYITLICLCWLEGTLPRDQGRLSRLCGVPLTTFRKLWPALDICFRAHPELADRLIHPRLERERQTQTVFRRRQSDNGKRGGRPRNPEEPKPLSGLSQTEAKKSSPISSLPSSSPISKETHQERVSPYARTGSGVMAGMLPRDHLRHSWCGRVCVPDFLHGQFLNATGQPEDVLKDFYAETLRGINPLTPVEPDALKFWRPMVTAKWAPQSVSTAIRPEDLVRTPEERERDEARDRRATRGR